MDRSSSSNTVTSHLRRYAIDPHKVSALAALVTAHLHVSDHSVAVAFVGARRMRGLNSRFRAKERSTDVLAFPQVEWSRARPVRARAKHAQRTDQDGPPKLLGDVVISLPDAERNAKSIGQALDREVCFLVVHGILHLAGYDHMTPIETRSMLKAQRRLVTYLRGTGRHPLWHRCVRLRA